MKELKNEELEKVNGGDIVIDESNNGAHMVTCPNCKEKFNGDLYQVDYGEGCEADIYYKCPYCQHEWR